MKTAILLVTYNSEKFIDQCIASIDAQTIRPDLIQIVDTGSKSFEYLKPYTKRNGVQFLKAEREAGFCRGNNLGVRHLPNDIDLLILLNPDCFLSSNFIEKTIQTMKANPQCGGYSALLEKYDLQNGAPTGFLDSVGIDRTWYGKWFDVGQGTPKTGLTKTAPFLVNALCGALFAIRGDALKEVLLPCGNLFDPTFYMYKEDIDLSIRLKEKGWELWMDPTITAYHCRGWSPNRKLIPKKMRLASARNECAIHWRLKEPIPLLYSTVKYLAVKGLNL